MRTNVYIDGFNFYYGAVKNRPADKWLDLRSLSALLIRRDQKLHRVRYFTAPVRSRASDPGQPARQASYFDALETLPKFTIHKGKFQSQEKQRPLKSNPEEIVWILDSEEKGSDVNLATHLLLDAVQGDMEGALIVTDDTDQIEPLRRVKSDLGIEIGVASPRQRPKLSRIVRAAYYRPIRPQSLAQHQLPNTVTAADGTTITKPTEWT